MTDERGTSSTCPECRKRVPKPAGRVFTCPHCPFRGHRDLVAAAHIAARCGGGITPVIVPAGVTHRRAGSHLSGVSPAGVTAPPPPSRPRPRVPWPAPARPARPHPGRAGSRSPRGEDPVSTDELTETCTKPCLGPGRQEPRAGGLPGGRWPRPRCGWWRRGCPGCSIPPSGQPPPPGARGEARRVEAVTPRRRSPAGVDAAVARRLGRAGR